MTNISKIAALGFGVTGITGLSIFTIMKRRKLAQEAFDAEIGEDKADETAVENDKDELPEFTKYTGIPVDTVTGFLNAVTHEDYSQGGKYYYIRSEDFESVKELLGVYSMYIRDNYSYFYLNDKAYVSGEMITFRIKKDYCVSNDGWFLISGTWKYLSKDEVRDDYIRCAQGKERLYNTNECFIK